MDRLRHFLLVMLLAWAQLATSQGISGFVQNSDNEPIPFANIYLDPRSSSGETTALEGTSSDSEGKYFLKISPGPHRVVISSVGYKTKTIDVVIGNTVLTVNVWLESDDKELTTVVVRASRRDPAYEIIQKVIENRERFRTQIERTRTHIYVKATEVIDEKERRRRELPSDEDLTPIESMDPFAEAQKELQTLANHLNFAEMHVELSYQYPNQFREERTAYKQYGSATGLYIPRLGFTDFNFYDNLVTLDGIMIAPLISPISRTAVLTYKFKLEETVKEDEVLVHKIKITARKEGASSCNGYIYINDSIWNINRLDLEFHKGSLKFFDHFRLIQSYQQVEDSLWIFRRQEFIYETKQGERKKFTGNTVLHYSDFRNNYEFPPRYFGNEVVTTTQEAYDRDSSYWNSTRPEPLSPDEKKVVSYRDSVSAVLNSKEYKDSIQALRNKVTVSDILFNGLGFSWWEKERWYRFLSLIDLVDFSVIGGFRLSPRFFYFKRWESGKAISISSGFSVGLKNLDIQPGLYTTYQYNAFKRASVTLGVMRSFQSIFPNDAYLNQLKISNYMLADRFDLGHYIEPVNGLTLFVRGQFTYRHSTDAFDRSSILNEVIEEDSALSFQEYHALLTEVRL